MDFVEEESMPILPDPPVVVVGDSEVRDEPAAARSKDDATLKRTIQYKLQHATRVNMGGGSSPEVSVSRPQNQQTPPAPDPPPSPNPPAEIPAHASQEEPPPPPKPHQSFLVEFKIPGFGMQEEEYDLFLPFEPEAEGARDRLLLLGYEESRRRKPFAPISKREDGSELVFSMTVGTDCENPMFFQSVCRLEHTGRSGPLGMVLIPLVAILNDKELQIASGKEMGPNLRTPGQMTPFTGARA